MKLKHALLSVLLLTVLCFAQCYKEDLDENGLPPATQEGKNTLGFLLNGQPWTPKGFNGTANLSIDVNFQYKKGIFVINAYRKVPSQFFDESIGFGIKDSLNFMSIPVTLQLHKESLYGIRFGDRKCSFFSTDWDTGSNGSLTITKLDKVKGIIAGTFSATLFKLGKGCDTIRITKGRFDMKF